jgi:hypothetical protein
LYDAYDAGVTGDYYIPFSKTTSSSSSNTLYVTYNATNPLIYNSSNKNLNINGTSFGNNILFSTTYSYNNIPPIPSDCLGYSIKTSGTAANSGPYYSNNPTGKINLITNGVHMEAGVYLIQLYSKNSGAGNGSITKINAALSTLTTSYTSDGTGEVQILGTTTVASGYIIGNYFTTFTVSLPKTFYYLQEIVKTNVDITVTPAECFFQYTRIA